ncbi:phycobilisome rod-core linker polypeptide [Cyanobium gracile UHCC 0139]|uniref:Phycobilisome rod-core linker polypeptide n=1 Tax=Cyanobium gracile UHCC 0139 TaxID=3110308 RepID=A0ABU5RVR7_9CYAN|nr:phycobilisome rod-core linker polypeptide [Cyanobium gracile]MEA5391870.1 phycobilisome rod-core linker polypeptide [Cyanobium gracile UHCC 0139]
MALVQAPSLGIERFADDRNKENWSKASQQDRDAIIRLVYQQVLGQQYVMQSERLAGAESLFRNGYLTVQEFVRTLARSGLYRSRFFENCNPYRFIELNHKHLLGRAPHNKAEMLHHFTILQEQGYDAEIDSYIDSPEYQERFGSDVVPYLHGWDYSAGHQGQQFSWLMQLAGGAAASVKGDSAGTRFKLGRALHQDRAVTVTVLRPRFSGESFFQANLAQGGASVDGPISRSGQSTDPGRGHREEALVVSAGVRGTSSPSGRVATITATGLVNNAVVRSGSYVMRVPYSRMNEALQRVQRLGGRVVRVSVN